MLQDSLKELLSMKDKSESSRHFYSDLYGLLASSKIYRREFSQSNDPAIEIFNKVIEAIEQLLEVGNPTTNIMLENDNNVNNSLPNRFKLKNLRDELLKDERLKFCLGNLQLATEDRDLWNQIQKLRLREEEELAQKWADLAYTFAQQAGAEIDDSEVVQLPYKENKLLYPGLKIVQAKGIYLSTEASLYTRFPQVIPDESIKFLAQIVSICVHFIETDPSLYRCNLFDITPFDSPEIKSDYINLLIDRFGDVQKSMDNPVQFLRNCIDLDEAIHSLVYLPPAKTGSWWQQLQNESRQIVKLAANKVRNNGHKVRTQWLLGSYQNIVNLTNDKTNLIAEKRYGNPGTVLICLRVYAEIGEEKILGRVIFCPF